ncbi:peptide deformylase [Streptococcus sp. zg-JUN1979]|uniref:peptide deformylase n=1 Tax=Streptococcus sp. zg-JUN1979 TaxID=3391450 RepID=UPI0039A58869
MIRDIVTDPFFLGKKSTLARKSDRYLAQDLKDTLWAHQDHCVGMAANMIGVNKRVIIIDLGAFDLVMFNPVILTKANPYKSKEACLSLIGYREVRRFDVITVSYWDEQWQPKRLRLTGFEAKICQHEMDHLEGILI